MNGKKPVTGIKPITGVVYSAISERSEDCPLVAPA